MKKKNIYKFISFVVLIFIISSILIVFNDASAAVRVKGYYRKDGTYVQPHYRSNPDGNPYNNWSFPGNVNPYTGNVAPGNPDTYLENYYNGTSLNSSYNYNSPANIQLKPVFHSSPPISNYRIYRVLGTLTIWELSYWQTGGFGTKKAFANPQAFIGRYGNLGWSLVKNISQSELSKYQDFGVYK